MAETAEKSKVDSMDKAATETDNETDDEDEPSPAKKWKSDGEEMYENLKVGKGVDAFLIVTKKHSRQVLEAHKSIMASKSPVLAAKFLGSPDLFWMNRDCFELPEQFGTAAALFLRKFMYISHKMERSAFSSLAMEISDVLEVIVMADMYFVDGLVPFCEQLLRSKLRIETCVQIYQGTKGIETLSKINQTAYEYIISKLAVILDRPKYSFEDWEPETWRCILNEDYLTVTELQLFQGLQRWKVNADEYEDVDEDEFSSLLSLVRFPLMKAADFANEVLPTHVLQPSDMLAILAHFANEGKTDTRFSAISRRIKVAKDAAAFRKLLWVAAEGDIIHLEAGEYHGDFLITTHNLTIRGAGNETILTGATTITIRGYGCELSDLQVRFIFTGIKSEGGLNSFKNINITKGNTYLSRSVLDHVGVDLLGEGCKLNTITIESDQQQARRRRRYNGQPVKRPAIVGIRSKSNNHCIKNITMRGIEKCIVLDGAHSVCLHSLNLYFHDQDPIETSRNNPTYGPQEHPIIVDSGRIAVSISAGSSLRAVDMTCHNLTDNDWMIMLGSDTKDCWFTRCENGQIFVDGDDHCFDKVCAAQLLTVNGTKHAFKNCTVASNNGKAFLVGHISIGPTKRRKISTVGCNFKF